MILTRERQANYKFVMFGRETPLSICHLKNLGEQAAELRNSGGDIALPEAVNCVGADTKGKRELPEGLLQRVRLFVDDRTQARQIRGRPASGVAR